MQQFQSNVKSVVYEPLKNAVTPLTLIISIKGVDKKGGKTKPTKSKTLNMLNRTMNGMDSNP